MHRWMIAALALAGCTAVNDDFEACSYEPPTVYTSPPCDAEYLACARACAGATACEEACLDAAPECRACYAATGRRCAHEIAECEFEFEDLTCCTDAFCPLGSDCAECQDEAAELNACWTSFDQEACSAVVLEVCTGIRL